MIAYVRGRVLAVTEETVIDKASYYSEQVRVYASALRRIFEKNIKAAFVYFFHIGRFVEVKID